MLTLAALIALYFLPSILARNKPSFTGILLLNFFLGWTGIFWLGALIWALSERELPRVAVLPVSAHRFCCSCGAPTPTAHCSHCGRVWA